MPCVCIYGDIPGIIKARNGSAATAAGRGEEAVNVRAVQVGAVDSVGDAALRPVDPRVGLVDGNSGGVLTSSENRDQATPVKISHADRIDRSELRNVHLAGAAIDRDTAYRGHRSRVVTTRSADDTFPVVAVEIGALELGGAGIAPVHLAADRVDDDVLGIHHPRAVNGLQGGAVEIGSIERIGAAIDEVHLVLCTGAAGADQHQRQRQQSGSSGWTYTSESQHGIYHWFPSRFCLYLACEQEKSGHGPDLYPHWRPAAMASRQAYVQ